MPQVIRILGEDTIQREMARMAKREIVWDLSEMFPSTTDPSVQKAIDDLTKMVGSFASRYQGRIDGLSAKKFLECIEDLEGIFAKLDRIGLFAYLSFMANMTLPDTQLVSNKVNKMKTELDKMLAFFNIEAANLVKQNPEITHEPTLQNYRHFLERLRREAAHQLSDVEEKLIIEKDQFGIRAWEELHGTWLSTRTFEVEVEGKKKVLLLSEVGGLMINPDRATRESAYKSINSLLGKDGEIFSSALRNICSDWLSVCDRRKYDNPMEASLIANDIDRQIISNLLTTVGNHVDLYQRHLKLKARIMRLPKLGGHDIWAPIPDAPNIKFDYDTTRTLIIEAYRRFDEDFAFAAEDMFAKNHIDAALRLGKANTGFSYGWYEGESAFILMNFNGALFDVYTLAHELGHSTHSYYCERNQTLLNTCDTWVSTFFRSFTPAIVTETASTFGELLLTDLLLSQSKSKQEKKAIICHILDEASGTIFWVTARAWFEQSLYAAIKRGEFLDYKTICRYWVEARDNIVGNAVEFIDEAEVTWTTTPHYYMPNCRFYNYPYVYAQLFVYALYQQYLKEGKEFVPKFKKALSAGCSISPLEIGKIVGLDVTDAHFWELGLRQYEHFVEELEKIVA
jgi:oligoendopeptidase F